MLVLGQLQDVRHERFDDGATALRRAIFELLLEGHATMVPQSVTVKSSDIVCRV